MLNHFFGNIAKMAFNKRMFLVKLTFSDVYVCAFV